MSIIYDNDELREKVRKALADEFKHEAIKTAQDTIGGKRDAIVQQESSWEQFRDKAADIRLKVLGNLDYYVREFATNAEKNGCVMHFAPTAEDALEAALDIFEQAGATSCVKSKSMMTEEIGLNEFLEQHGIEPIETDCAESIIQTAGDAPSHIVVPALHFDRRKIRDLFAEKKGYTGTEEPEEITHFLREHLRPQFLSAKVGVTGCNFGVANTGSCTLVTNEGNGRMASTIPDTQIIFMGIERIVPDMESLDVFMKLLVPSAVGAKITSSFSINTGPRKEGEADGPANVHIIMIDNGRSKILGTKYRDMLRCIRCGACMNTCPVYRHITGHGYGSIYPGPMGIVLTPLLTGYEAAEKLPFACSLCGACDDVCPTKIPLHSLVIDHREDMKDQGYVSNAEKTMYGSAMKMLSNRKAYDLATSTGNRGMKLVSSARGRVDDATAWIPIVGGWTASRDMDLLANKKFRYQFADYEKARRAGDPLPLASSEIPDYTRYRQGRVHRLTRLLANKKFRTAALILGGLTGGILLGVLLGWAIFGKERK